MNESSNSRGADLRRLESSVSQLSTAIHWLSASLVNEAKNGRSFGMAMAAQMDGPVRALSMALMNLNDGVAEILEAAEKDLRDNVSKEYSKGIDIEVNISSTLARVMH